VSAKSSNECKKNTNWVQELNMSAKRVHCEWKEFKVSAKILKSECNEFKMSAKETKVSAK
jgi:hypothetical protein